MKEAKLVFLNKDFLESHYLCKSYSAVMFYCELRKRIAEDNKNSSIVIRQTFFYRLILVVYCNDTFNEHLIA